MFSPISNIRGCILNMYIMIFIINTCSYSEHFPPPNPIFTLPHKTPFQTRTHKRDFPGSAVVKNPPANAEDTGSSPGPGISHLPQNN